jgi:signal transduction histidine kinase
MAIAGIDSGSPKDKEFLLKTLIESFPKLLPSYSRFAGSVSYLSDLIKTIHADEKRRALFSKTAFAIHPSYFRSIERIADAQYLITSPEYQPRVGFIADIAHLFLANDDILRTLDTYKDAILSIHVNDWSPKFGRNYLTFSKGFCELGLGVLSNDSVLRDIRSWIDRNYNGWVVMVHNNPDPQYATIESLKRSLAWWREDKSVNLHTAGIDKSAIPATAPVTTTNLYDDRANRIAVALMASRRRTFGDFYRSLVITACREFACRYVNLWEVDTRNDVIVLQASIQNVDGQLADIQEKTTCIPIAESLSWQTLEQNSLFDASNLRERAEDGTFKDPELVRDLNLTRLISLPVRNSYQPEQTVLLLNCFWSDPLSEKEAHAVKVTLNALASILIATYQGVMDSVEAEIFEDLNTNPRPFTRYSDLLANVTDRVRKYLPCDHIVVFSYDQQENRLRCVYSSHLRDLITFQKSFEPHESIAVDAISRCATRLEHNKDNIKQSHLLSYFCPRSSSYIIKPNINDAGKLRGIVICSGKTPIAAGRKSPQFTIVDDAVLDFFYLATKEQFRSTIAYERSIQAIRTIRHEMLVPSDFIVSTSFEIGNLIARRHSHTVEVLRDLIRRRLVSFSDLGISSPGSNVSVEAHLRAQINFRSEKVDEAILRVVGILVRDILDYEYLLRHKIEDLEFFRRRADLFVDATSCHHLQSEIFMPAKHHCRKLLFDESLDESFLNRIYIDVLELKSLYIDKRLWTHLVFNMLENAIKYRLGDHSTFSVQISGAYNQSLDRFEIRFTDRGVGIESDEKEAIFDEFYRGQNTRNRVKGEGIGLWMVRRIIKRHGGEISVESACSPTTFLISLPSSLKDRPFSEASR